MLWKNDTLCCDQLARFHLATCWKSELNIYFKMYYKFKIFFNHYFFYFIYNINYSVIPVLSLTPQFPVRPLYPQCYFPQCICTKKKGKERKDTKRLGEVKTDGRCGPMLPRSGPGFHTAVWWWQRHPLRIGKQWGRPHCAYERKYQPESPLN